MAEISVIIPVYNGAKFIKRCYDSLVAQTFEDFEMIFVDDGSKDNSLLILNQLKEKDSRVKVIAQENKKQGGARNTGVKAACGKYISFVDVDDYVSSDFLQGMYEVSEKYDCDISTTSVVRHKTGKNEQYLIKYDEVKEYTNTIEKAKVVNGDGSGRGVWNKLIRRDFLEKNNLNFRENVFYEDCDYCAKIIFSANKVVTVSKGCYYYFVNQNSTMRSCFDKKKQEDKYIGAKTTLLFELKHGIAEGFQRVVKYDYKLFGINVLRIKEKIGQEAEYEEWWLFDFIKIYQKKIK